MGADLYDSIGRGYRTVRQPDPRFAAAIHSAIGSASVVLNVGAGTGSYEPTDISVIAVEPSRVMLAQRPASAAPVVQAVAESLPFADKVFDVALALLTVHHWRDAAAGLAEMQRVAHRQVILTWDRNVLARQFWFARDYLPESIEREMGLATVDEIVALLGDRALVTTVPVPRDCTDGFYAAYWSRPHAYLDSQVRDGISALTLTDQRYVERAVIQLQKDLDSGAWAARYGDLMGLTDFDLGYRIVTT